MHGNGFAKGIIVGSIIGVTVSMIMNSDMVGRKQKKNWMKKGRNLARKSGDIVSNVMELFM